MTEQEHQGDGGAAADADGHTTDANTDARGAGRGGGGRGGRRRRWAPYVLVVFLAVGFLLFRDTIPHEASVVMSLPPSVVVGDGERVSRSEVVALDVRVYDGEDEVAHSELTIPGGMTGPRAPMFSVRLRSGSYLVAAEAHVGDGVRARLGGVLEVDGDDYVNVSLR